MGKHKAQRSKFHKLLNNYYYARKKLDEVIRYQKQFKTDVSYEYHQAKPWERRYPIKYLRNLRTNQGKEIKKMRYEAEVALSKAQEALHDFIS